MLIPSLVRNFLTSSPFWCYPSSLSEDRDEHTLKVPDFGAECERNRQTAVFQYGSRGGYAGFHDGLWALTKHQ